MPKNLRGSRDLGHAHIGNFCPGSCRDYPWEHACQIWSSYLQPFWSYQHLTPRKITGSRDGDHDHCLETFVRCHVGTISGNTPAKFEVRIFSHFETIAFNTQKLTGSPDRDHAHFLETFVRCHVGTIPGNTPAKFEVRIFSRFGAISI